MTRRITRIAGPALAGALLLFSARPTPAAWQVPACLDWHCGPRASLPICSPTYGFNATCWQTWPAGCAGPQPATLVSPVIGFVGPAAPPDRPGVPFGSTPAAPHAAAAPREAAPPVSAYMLIK